MVNQYLISKCVIEEGKIKKEKGEIDMLASHNSKASSSKGPRKFERSNNHTFKKESKEGNHLALVCFKLHFIDVPINSSWFDNIATAHIVISL